MILLENQYGILPHQDNPSFSVAAQNYPDKTKYFKWNNLSNEKC